MPITSCDDALNHSNERERMQPHNALDAMLQIVINVFSKLPNETIKHLTGTSIAFVSLLREAPTQRL